MAFVHPFDDPDIVAGQGTLGAELLEDVTDLAKVVVPLGGGGLASGSAMAIKSKRPDVEVVGVQVDTFAPYPESLRRGVPVKVAAALTIADGIAIKSPGELTLPLVREWLDGVVVVPEDDVAEAIVLLMEKAKLVVEGAGAVGVAALLGGQVAPAAHGTTVVVLSGGNIDACVLATVARRHESEAGRRLVLVSRVPDRPGALAGLLSLVGEAGASSSTSRTCAKASICTCARRSSNSCSRPARASTPPTCCARSATPVTTPARSTARPRRRRSPAGSAPR